MWIPFYVLGAALMMMVVEHLRPGRDFPKVRGWWTRALLLNGLQAVIIFLAGWAWDEWLARHRPWDADGLGIVSGAVVGYVVHAFVYYWWHRWRHEVPLLWRWLHQVHHAPQRIEIITSFYKHPLEILTNSLLSSIVLYLLVGLGPEAAAGAFLLSGLAELLYHWNVRTPRWLGYLVQRPESHCLHHQEGVHAFNYGDLPVFDMLFGTFRNPGRWDGRTGFGSEVEEQLAAMLVGRDITSAEVR